MAFAKALTRATSYVPAQQALGPARRSISFRGAGRARSELQFRAGSGKAAIAEFWRAMFLRKASWIMQEIEGILPYGRLDGRISLRLGMEKARQLISTRNMPKAVFTQTPLCSLSAFSSITL